VEAAEARLWSPEGADALAYLTGARCLNAEAIRAARLGWTPTAWLPNQNGDCGLKRRGWVIPWFTVDGLALVKIRQPDEWQPKYVEAFRDPARLTCYPSPETIRPGRPLVVVEGEFDALLLGQELTDLAAVVTLGSASARPTTDILRRFLSASPWFVATDGDDAGDRSAAGWPARARRVRPPEPFKDWTEAKAGCEGFPVRLRHGVNLRRWWRDRLAGGEKPPLYTWDELSTLRWGPGLTDGGAAGIDAHPPRAPRPT
jgi:hypothetical protein